MFLLAWLSVVPISYRNSRSATRLLHFLSLGVALSVVGEALPAMAANGGYIADNTPGFVAKATDGGSIDPASTLSIAVWLKPRNQAALDSLAAALYDPTSLMYRKWLKRADLVSQFAPTAAQSETVRGFLQDSGLTAITEGPDHFYLRATGTAAQIEQAFHVKIEIYEFGGQAIYSNSSNPYIEGSASALVQTVSGLDNVQFQHSAQLQSNISPAALSARAAGSVLAPTGAADLSAFQSACFGGPATTKVTSSGGYPKATYKGTTYAAAGAGCGYTPANVTKAFHLDKLFAEGYNGAGQTMILIEPCGSPTITADANTFSKQFNLPLLTDSNFSIVHYPGPTECAGEIPSINGEVEWAHAIAPGAKIVLMVPPSALLEDIDEATYYAVTSGIGNTLSGTYQLREFGTSIAEARKQNLLSELAAIMGVATNYGSGDYGTFGYEGVTTVSIPADLPYATGVGGTTAALNTDGSLAWQVGWETHISYLVGGGVVQDPSRTAQADPVGFVGGSGGGTSQYFAKPSFQSALPGAYRKVPDIAWLGDVFTGALIVVSQTAVYPPQSWYAYGGTELSTTMFSALWAIANQEAGVPLGQATPYLYRMPASTITDMVPETSANNVTARVELSASSVQAFDPFHTLGAFSGFGQFRSAYGVDSLANVYDISFGQDYLQHPKVGWDTVTGLGAPNAQAFADWFRAP